MTLALDVIAMGIVLVMLIALLVALLDWLLEDEDRSVRVVFCILSVVAVWSVWRVLDLGMRWYASR